MIHPNHPLFTVSKETLKIRRDEDINGNKYGYVQCVQLIEVFQYCCFRPEFLS